MADDNQLWKGFNGHGLYAKRAEKDRNGEDIVTTYAKQSEVPALTDELNTSSTTAVTPNAVKEAIDAIVKIPDTANQPSTLYVGGQGMGWTGWETEEYMIPQKLPPHCVLLDYFTDGYRLGVESTGGTFTSLAHENMSSLNYSKTFPEGMPVAVFDESTYNPTMNYDLTALINPNDGYSFEYWVKMNAVMGNNVYYACNHMACDNKSDFRLIYYNNNSIGYNCVDSIGNSSYRTGGASGAMGATTWHHIAVTRTGSTIQLYINGRRGFSDTVYTYTSVIPSISLVVYQCTGNVNSSFRRQCAYSMAQLAVWDYPKYTSNFTPDSTLIVDQTFE